MRILSYRYAWLLTTPNCAARLSVRLNRHGNSPLFLESSSFMPWLWRPFFGERHGLLPAPTNTASLDIRLHCLGDFLFLSLVVLFVALRRPQSL